MLLVQNLIALLRWRLSRLFGHPLTFLVNCRLEAAILQLYLFLGLLVQFVVFLLLEQVLIHILIVLVGALIFDDLRPERARLQVLPVLQLLQFNCFLTLYAIVCQVFEQFAILIIISLFGVC